MFPASLDVIYGTAAFLCGLVCVSGYLASYALVRRLHEDRVRPTIRPRELLRPLGAGILLGAVILASQPDGPLMGRPLSILWFLVLSVGLAGVCAGGWTARRTGPVSITAVDLVRRLCIAGDSHEDATARIAVRLALAAGYDPAGASDLLAAASLHDIGKTGLNEALLADPDRLDPDQQRHLQNHTRLGYRMLSRSDEPMLDLAADIALHHHERWDGTGYPNGFAEQQIPFTSRVVALAARLDDLVGACVSIEEIAAVMRQEAGTRFDPKLVDLLLEDLPGMVSARHADGLPGDGRRDARIIDEQPLGAWLGPNRFRPLRANRAIS